MPFCIQNDQIQKSRKIAKNPQSDNRYMEFDSPTANRDGDLSCINVRPAEGNRIRVKFIIYSTWSSLLNAHKSLVQLKTFFESKEI